MTRGVKKNVGRYSMAGVLAATLEASGVRREVLISEERKGRITKWRHAAMYVCREQGYSLPQIGAVFARDHSSVSHAVKTIRRRVGEQHPATMVMVGAIRAELGDLEAYANLNDDGSDSPGRIAYRRAKVVREVRAAVSNYRIWQREQAAARRDEMARLARLGWTTKGLARRYGLPPSVIEREINSQMWSSGGSA